MSAHSRIVAVDYGTKRVGLAVSDPMRIFAQPFGVSSQDEAVARLRQLHAEEGIEVIVVGWPLTESGKEGPATQRVQEFINRLRNVLPTVEYVRWDERYTSEEAKDRLRPLGTLRKRRSVDDVAAGILLQEYLEDARVTKPPDNRMLR